MTMLLHAIVSCAMFASAVPVQSTPAPLPAFTVTAVTGETTPSASLAVAGRHLLLYVDPRLPSSDDLLQLWRAEDPGAALVVIVVRVASVAELGPMRDRYPALGTAGWYADTNGSVVETLQLPGTPATLALEGQTVAWNIRGVLTNRQQMRTLVFDWLAGR
jgi:hypothetical protein